MIDIAIVAFYMIAVLVVGLMSGLKVRDMKDYAVAKNSFSTFVIVATIFATLIGGGATMGVSEKIFSTGLVFLLACFGFVIRDLLTAFFIVPKFDRFAGCLTVGDIMGTYYGKVGQILVGVAGTLQASVYLSMQVAAVGHLLNYFLDLPYTLGVIIGLGIVIVYSALGGMKAVTITDAIQFGVLIIAIPVTFTIGVEMVGGFYGLLNSVPPEKLSLIPKTGDQIRFYSLLFVFILPNMTPALAQRFLMGKDAAQIKKALMISAFARVPYFIMVAVLGLVAFILEPTLQADMAFPYLVSHILPVGIRGLVIAGVMAIIMSTADSLLHVAGLSLTHDVIKPICGDKLSEQGELRIARWMTLFIGVIAVTAALSTTNIIELSILAYAFWLPGIAVPLVASILGARASMNAFLLSATGGLGTFLMWRAFFYEETHIDSLLPSVLMSACIYFVFFVFEKKKFGGGGEDWQVLTNNKQLSNLLGSSTKQAANFFSRYFDKLVDQSTQKVEVFGAPYGMFVLFSVANLCFVPFIFANTSGGITPKFVVYLRVIASIFSFLLVMKDFWSRRLLKYLPLFWHITLFFCLPFFAISMCLFSSCAIEWVIDLVLTIFILGILVDWKTYISTILLGGLFAAISFILFGDLTQFDPNIGNFPIMTYAIIVSVTAGALFSRNKERVLMEKLVTFKALGGTIAHEMRTPLSSIHVSASGLKDCLPALVDGYSQARAAGLRVPKISQLALESVASIPERMRYICASTLNIIDMLLLQLKDNDWSAHFSTCSARECVDIALNEYCFRENEKSLIDVSGVEDFNFYGNRYLVVHILYNLMRNAFTFIQSEKKGVITIWTSESPNERHLHFCDTAKGINKRDLPHIFEHGFSKRSGGSGVGLHYCRRMMTAMAGAIAVNSVEGKYCEFVLTFSKT
jgi:Na+/proline symporter/signal transduction histidine kinase